MIASNKEDHNQRCQKRDGNGRDRMGIKNFQKLNIRRDDRNKISLVSAFQFCRAKTLQSRKNLVADNCQKLKGNKMVAVLLDIMQHTAQNSQASHQKKELTDTDTGKSSRIHAFQVF